MKFDLPPLPYALDALEPHIGRRTLEIHYGKHHQTYLDKLQSLIAEKPEASQTLEEIIRAAEGPVFNNAAQVWNHTFYWNSMRPGGGGEPRGGLAETIRRDFGSWEAFRERFIQLATAELFGSGYVWLVRRADTGRVVLEATSNAATPLTGGGTPLLGLDMWEHAYYLDYQNQKARYVEAFLAELANWDFAEGNLEGAG